MNKFDGTSLSDRRRNRGELAAVTERSVMEFLLGNFAQFKLCEISSRNAACARLFQEETFKLAFFHILAPYATEYIKNGLMHTTNQREYRSKKCVITTTR